MERQSRSRRLLTLRPPGTLHCTPPLSTLIQMDELTRANLEFARLHPGDSAKRQPVHVVYGGAQLFKSDTARRLGSLAERALHDYAPDPASLSSATGIPDRLAGIVHARVIEKLRRQPVEDLRLDFEDGYGFRPDAEEDATADAAAAEFAKGFAGHTLPPFIGIRIKSLAEETKARALRTLDRFLNALFDSTGGLLPENFVVTLPKITVPEQVTALIDALNPFGGMRIEMMIETTESMFLLPRLIEAAQGRCAAVHFGAYDYTASLGMTAANQNLLHPACDFARAMIQARLAGTGVRISDGATNLLPIPPHRVNPGGEPLGAQQIADNRTAMHRAWRVHCDHIRHSLHHGFYQSWDLHPAQLVSRFAAVYAFFLESLDAASNRLRNFIAQAAQATQSGGVFDDAATGQGLLNFFLRAVNCGAIPEAEVPALTGLSLEELRSASFLKI